MSDNFEESKGKKHLDEVRTAAHDAASKRLNVNESIGLILSTSKAERLISRHRGREKDQDDQPRQKASSGWNSPPRRSKFNSSQPDMLLADNILHNLYEPNSPEPVNF